MSTPAYAMTYDNLSSNVLQYLERQDAAVVEQIPNFIMLAEFEIAEMMKSLGQQQVAESVMEVGNPVIPKPARWRKTTSFNVTVGGKKQPVYLRKYEYVINYNPDNTVEGAPLYYADYDYDNWIVAPTPDANYSFEVLYYERIQPLSSDNQTNWLTRNAPNAMLYGTLLQAMPFLKNDQRVIFQQKYTEAITALSNEDKLRVADRQAIAQDS
jgi:hypothetical protein